MGLAEVGVCGQNEYDETKMANGWRSGLLNIGYGKTNTSQRRRLKGSEAQRGRGGLGMASSWRRYE